MQSSKNKRAKLLSHIYDEWKCSLFTYPWLTWQPLCVLFSQNVLANKHLHSFGPRPHRASLYHQSPADDWPEPFLWTQSISALLGCWDTARLDSFAVTKRKWKESRAQPHIACSWRVACLCRWGHRNPRLFLTKSRSLEKQLQLN